MSARAKKTGADDSADPAFLTTKEVAALLRVRERKVYDMAAAGEIPCLKITGKLLFPKEELEAWLNGDVARPGLSAAAPPSILVGSHDPLLVWALGASGCDAPTLFGGSLDGLERLARGDAMACALHLYDRERGAWNVPAIEAAGLEDRFVLIGFAKRRQGLVFPSGAPEIAEVSALQGRRVVLRQKAAGGRLLLEELLAAANVSMSKLDIADEEARSETELAEAVADGRAEAALGLEAMAQRYGLGFTPLIEESFDLLIERRAYFAEPLQSLFRFFRTDAFRERAAAFAGYDLSDCGAVRWNGAGN